MKVQRNKEKRAADKAREKQKIKRELMPIINVKKMENLLLRYDYNSIIFLSNMSKNIPFSYNTYFCPKERPTFILFIWIWYFIFLALWLYDYFMFLIFHHFRNFKIPTLKISKNSSCKILYIIINQLQSFLLTKKSFIFIQRWTFKQSSMCWTN